MTQFHGFTAKLSKKQLSENWYRNLPLWRAAALTFEDRTVSQKMWVGCLVRINMAKLIRFHHIIQTLGATWIILNLLIFHLIPSDAI